MSGITKKISVILVLVMLLLTFTACGKNKGDGMQIHESVTNLEQKLSEVNSQPGTVKANLYFDNTQSMHGYVCDGYSGKSIFDIVCQDIIDVLRGYNDYTLNALRADDKKVLQWKKMSVGEFSYTAKDFYTYTGSFAKKTDGPLSTLFEDEKTPVNFDELNLFITDLAEQNLNNKDLAIIINDIVLNKSDHSVVLFCIDSMFTGTAYAPESGVVTDSAVDMREVNYNGERPFYCLVVGPTIEVIAMRDALKGSIDGSGLIEGEDYNIATVLSKRGIQYSSIENAEYAVFNDYCSDPEKNEENDYYLYSRTFGFDNSNLNFNMQSVKYDEIFDVNKTYPGLCFDYNTVNGSREKSTYGNGSLNFIIPMSDLADGSKATDVKYSINAESVKVYGCCQNEYEVTNEDGRAEDVEIRYEWEEIPYFDCFEKTESYMSLPEMKYLEKGEIIYRISDYETNAGLEKDDFPKEKLPLYTVDNESGEIWINIRFKDIKAIKEKYSAITICFNIDASRNVSDEVPPWISEYTLVEKSVVSDDEFISKTTGLREFYSFLVGKMSSKTERDKFETYMTKNVSDIVVNVDFVK